MENGTYYDPDYAKPDGETNSGASNGDFQAAVPQILQNLDSIRRSQKQVLQSWNHKKIKLDQCFQLRLFEQDCEKMYDWVCRNRDVFLMNYIEIGETYQAAKDLQEEHNHFTFNSMVSGEVSRFTIFRKFCRNFL